MVLVNRIKMSLAQRAALENAIAKAEKNSADLEYIAMMTDVELDTDEPEVTSNVE